MEKKNTAVCGIQSNAGTIHGLYFFRGATYKVRVKHLCGVASVREGITKSKEWQPREKEGEKLSLLQSISSESE